LLTTTEWSEETTGLCPTCLRTVPAVLRREEDDTIWITQTCPRHGENRALLSSDADEYLRFRTYVPGRVSGACCGPDEVCGPNDGPPTCVLLLEITQACNLRCPTCYADAHGHDFMTVGEAKERLDSFFRAQTRLDMLMLSGGEPTIHPKFREILELALSYPIGRILVNTNGLRLNQSEELVALLGSHRNRVELYFSFASFKPEVHERLYGRDLVEIKKAAMNRAREAKILMTLVPTVERGVNETEIGDLYRYALSTENINGITFQPVMDNGRYENAYDPAQRMTLTGVLALLAEQTDGALLPSDFVGLPCSHPDCCVLTFGFLDSRREVITPLPRHLDVARYLDCSPTASRSRASWAARPGVSGPMSATCADRQTIKDLTALSPRRNPRRLPLLKQADEIGRRLFRVAIKPFMDAQTYDHKRIDECCTKILNDKARPFLSASTTSSTGPQTKSRAHPLMMVK
jgi:uncharacterized radical SAM superfamily Fe-S cluster-containing enzyme